MLPEPGQTYDLPTLIDVALRNNPDTRASWEAARAAAARYGRSLAPFYPVISARADVSPNARFLKESADGDADDPPGQLRAARRR